jgi:hypothetical protein
LDDVRVDPQGDAWIGMTKPRRDHVHRDPGQQQPRRVDVPEALAASARVCGRPMGLAKG